MYKKIVFPILSWFDAETIHHFTFRFLKVFFKIPGARSMIQKMFVVRDPHLERTLFGLRFASPVGLAAGFDKDAVLFEELGNFGFGFIEIGTVTPEPQVGNDKPRLFRLKKDRSLLNRMGFNNDGMTVIAGRLRQRRKSGLIVGGNIGKNKITPNEKAGDDYEKCFQALFEYVDYFVVNVSSPNTPGLRALQDKGPLMELLRRLQTLNKAKKTPKPILLKIAPDLNNEQLDDIIAIVKETGIAGVIATNTTISRENLQTPKARVEALGAGGVSGAVLKKRATEVVRYLSEHSGKAFPIVAVGGVMSAEDALEKLQAGASLVQIYAGFVYEGPSLVKHINQAILNSTHL